MKLDVLKPWITKRTTELLKMEDDVVVEFIFNQLEEKVRHCSGRLSSSWLLKWATKNVNAMLWSDKRWAIQQYTGLHNLVLMSTYFHEVYTKSGWLSASQHCFIARATEGGENKTFGIRSFNSTTVLAHKKLFCTTTSCFKMDLKQNSNSFKESASSPTENCWTATSPSYYSLCLEDLRCFS